MSVALNSFTHATVSFNMVFNIILFALSLSMDVCVIFSLDQDCHIRDPFPSEEQSDAFAFGTGQ